MDCNLGSEIGQKMRSAVKAKLLELGTGGSSGFIDDELPDYVMVMVANKRTKQQMNAELNLFLGDQTDLFVTWLHEVLQKLQEVTLPTPSAASKKRKSRQAEVPKVKDKKSAKKDKKGHRKFGDDAQSSYAAAEPSSSTTAAEAVPVISSITDVFAEELLEKAKKNLDVDTNMKDEILQKKKKRKSGDEQSEALQQDFDIPTMSEISSTTSGNLASTAKDLSGNREKDLAELAEIQRKIYAAKQHLRKIGELDDDSEHGDDNDDDEDFLNLNEQDESVSNDLEEAPKSSHEATPRKTKSPIVFNRRTRTPEPPSAPLVVTATTTTSTRDKEVERAEIRSREADRPANEERGERRSVHERLGSKPLPLEQRPERVAPRAQKELYVPAHRRRSEPEAPRSRERGPRERSRERRSSRERDAGRGRRSPRRSPSLDIKQRIGSRVIVAANKPPEPSDDEDMLEKPLNSVIKIKPRPQVSPRRQACKNLLLRAVADAQRSTILAKPTAGAKKDSDEPELISSTLGKRKSHDRTGAGSKSYREQERERERELDRTRIKRGAPRNELFRRTTRELVVNVLQHDAKRSRSRVTAHVEAKLVKEEQEEEYVPALSVDDYSAEYAAYVPQLVDEDIEMENIELHVGANEAASPTAAASKTQFVVTLNGDKALGSYRKRSSAARKRSSSPATPQVSSTSAAAVAHSTEPSSTTSSGSGSGSRRRKPDTKSTRERTMSPSSSNTPPPLVSRSLLRSEVLRQPQEIKKLIIKNADSDEEDDPSLHQVAVKTRSSRTATKRLSSEATTTAANGHIKPQALEEERSTTPPLPPKRPSSSVEKREKSPAVLAPALQPAKSKHTPIRFTLKPDDELAPLKKRRSGSQERGDANPRDSSLERRKISIRTVEDKKYDNLPALSAVSVDSTVLKAAKPKERCKYHPSCTKQFCDYYHPTAPCKSFPNCKFADKCMYSHPKCKFDMSCMSLDCNYAHSGARDLSHVPLSAPPLSSHVIPVQNYKSISAPVTATTATTMCKYYPNCTKAGCTFYHPKPCRYGKNCINKLECIFYHPEMQSKFKWVASLG